MAVKAYVLIEAAIGKAASVAAAVRNLATVVEVNIVAGPYDIVAEVQAETSEQVGRLVMEDIHNVDGVNYTMTCVVVGG